MHKQVGDIMRKLLGESDSTKAIFNHNKNYLTAKLYLLGTGDRSFNALIEKKMEGESRKNIIHPFLQEEYDKYENYEDLADEERPEGFKNHKPSRFEDYVIALDTTMVILKANVLVTPYQRDSFALKLIKEYNKNEKEITKLKQQLDSGENLSFLQRADLKRREDLNQALRGIMNVWQEFY